MNKIILTWFWLKVFCYILYTSYKGNTWNRIDANLQSSDGTRSMLSAFRSFGGYTLSKWEINNE